jgi:hypothetical protein
MGILKKASTETHNIMLDETDYITVRNSISKKAFNAIATAMPKSLQGGDADSLDLGEAMEFQRELFGFLVVGWSLPYPPTVDEYDALDTDAGNAVDKALGEYFETLTPSSAEGKSPSTSPEITPQA